MLLVCNKDKVFFLAVMHILHNKPGVSYCKVCAFVREDNPRASAETRGLSPYIHTTIQQLSYCTSMHVHTVHCEMIDVKR